MNLKRFIKLAKTCPVAGVPNNLSIDQLEDYINSKDSVTLKFGIKGHSIARCYWTEEGKDEWEGGGCISLLLTLEIFRTMLQFDEKIDAMQINSDYSIDFHTIVGKRYNYNNGKIKEIRYNI